MQQGNYAIAYCLWQPLADANDAQAQFNIGWMYHNGYGLSINDDQTLNWWFKAASNGSIDALTALGDLYTSGQGVEKNTAIALGWYIAAARRGDNIARETLLSFLGNQDPLTLSIFKQILLHDWSILGNTYQVKVDKANTRSGPSKNYPVVTTLEQGHPVIGLQSESNWIYIGITGLGKTAWIYRELLTRPDGIYPKQSVE
jgi:uncharacterized protein YgiM (DUF1202 family)